MKKTISPGRSDFTKMINRNNFYIDKTRFIVEWYKEDRDVTLITRPRRFGKTLTLSMMERFFSLKYANQNEIFHGLDVSTDPEIMKLQGTMPVIKMSFSSMNPKSYDDFLDSLSAEVVNAYKEYQYLLYDDIAELDKEEITTIIKPRLNNEKKRVRLSNTEIYLGIKELCRILFEKYGKKALVLLDEYDTPLQTAYVEGYWKDACGFITQMFDAIFKTNDYIEYGIITGITRIVSATANNNIAAAIPLTSAEIPPMIAIIPVIAANKITIAPIPFPRVVISNDPRTSTALANFCKLLPIA